MHFLHRCAHSMTLYEAVGDAWASSKDGDLEEGHKSERKKMASKPETKYHFPAFQEAGPGRSVRMMSVE